MARRRIQPSRILFWVGLVICVIALFATSIASTGPYILWITTHTHAMLGGGALQLAIFHKGTLGLDDHGIPSHMIGRPAIWAASIPLWFILLVATTLTFLAWAWGRRRPAAACPSCNELVACSGCHYPLIGLPANTPDCPECGRRLAAPRRRRFRFCTSHIIAVVGLALCIALIMEMIFCRDSKRLVWLTKHTYCVFKYDIMELAWYDSQLTLDARGVPTSIWQKPTNPRPFRLTQIPTWSLLSFFLVLTLIASFWGRRPWAGPCPACGHRGGRRRLKISRLNTASVGESA
jgi:hypothetical protein